MMILEIQNFLVKISLIVAQRLITTLQQCCVSCVSCVSCVTVVCYALSSNVLYVFHPMDQYYVAHSKKTSIIEVITDME